MSKKHYTTEGAEQPELFTYMTVDEIKWLSYDRLAESYGLCKATVRSRVKEIRQQLGKGKRYPAQSVIDDGNLILVNEYVFLDWLSVRTMMQDGELQKHVEPFRVDPWANLAGRRTFPRRLSMEEL